MVSTFCQPRWTRPAMYALFFGDLRIIVAVWVAAISEDGLEGVLHE